MTKIGIVVLSDMETHSDMARVVTALEAAKEFKAAGDEVEIIFDGGGVVSAVAIADPGSKLHRLYTHVQDNIAGVCRYCSRSFEVYDQAEALGLPLLAEYDQHPSLRRLAVEGYQIITF